MKKLAVIILICAICVSVFSFAPSVFAEGEKYYYIKSDATMLIDNADKGISGTINLPASWYVKSIGKAVGSDGMISVEYNGVVGKVDSTKLSKKTTELTTSPYFNAQIESVQSNDALPITLYSDSAFSVTISQTLPTGSKITVLAVTATNNYLISYISASETKYAFLRKSHVNNVDVTVSENVNKKDPDQLGGGDSLTPPTNDNQNTNPTNNVLRIVLIIGVCVLAVLLVFLIFKPSSKKTKKDDFYDDYRP